MKTPGRRVYVQAIFSSWSADALYLSEQTPPFAKVPILLVFYSTKSLFLYSMDNNYHATLSINETSSSMVFYAILEQQNNVLWV